MRSSTRVEVRAFPSDMTLLLCRWLAAVGRAWQRVDPRAGRMPRFLAHAVPATDPATGIEGR